MHEAIGQASNTRGIFAITRDWMMMMSLIVIGVYIDNIWLMILLSWPIGMFQYALGEVLVHEASHYNLFRTRSLHGRLEFLYARPFLRTVNGYRAEHLPHHAKFGSADDPIEISYHEMGLFQPETSIFYLWFVYPMIGGPTYQFLVGLLTDVEYLKRNTIPLLVYCALGVVTAMNGILFEYLVMWIFPLVYWFRAFEHWQEMTDHFATRGHTRSNVSYLGNLIAHNGGYHHAHHCSPKTPWFALKNLQHGKLAECPDITHGFFDTYKHMILNREQYLSRRRSLAAGTVTHSNSE